PPAPVGRLGGRANAIAGEGVGRAGHRTCALPDFRHFPFLPVDVVCAALTTPARRELLTPAHRETPSTPAHHRRSSARTRAQAPAWSFAQASSLAITSRPRGRRRSHNHVPVGLILGVGSSGPMRGGKTRGAPHGTEPRAVHLPSRAASDDPAFAEPLATRLNGTRVGGGLPAPYS